MDREIFINSRGFHNSIAERKLLHLLNEFTHEDDFRVFTDRDGFGYADERPGRGVSIQQATNILAARPNGGFFRATLLYNIEGVGADTISDMLMGAMRLVDFPRTRSIKLYIHIAQIGDETPALNRLDVLLYARLSGTGDLEPIPMYRQTVDLQEGLLPGGVFEVEFDDLPEGIEEVAIVAAREDSVYPIFRSGMFMLHAQMEANLSSAVFLINERVKVEPDDLNETLMGLVGQEFQVDGNMASLTELSVEFPGRDLRLTGQIVAEDTFAFADSSIDFKTDIFLYRPGAIREGLTLLGYRVQRTNLDSLSPEQLVGTSTYNVMSEHSNWLLNAFKGIGVLIPGIGGFVLPALALSTDNSQDNNALINAAIGAEIRRSFSDQSVSILATEIENFATSNEALFGSAVGQSFYPGHEASTPAEKLQITKDLMVKLATLDELDVDSSGISLSAWVAVPYVF